MRKLNLFNHCFGSSVDCCCFVIVNFFAVFLDYFEGKWLIIYIVHMATLSLFGTIYFSFRRAGLTASDTAFLAFFFSKLRLLYLFT